MRAECGICVGVIIGKIPSPPAGTSIREGISRASQGPGAFSSSHQNMVFDLEVPNGEPVFKVGTTTGPIGDWELLMKYTSIISSAKAWRKYMGTYR